MWHGPLYLSVSLPDSFIWSEGDELREKKALYQTFCGIDIVKVCVSTSYLKMALFLTFLYFGIKCTHCDCILTIHFFYTIFIYVYVCLYILQKQTNVYFYIFLHVIKEVLLLCECVWVRVSVCGCVWVCVFSPWSVKITSLIGRPLFQVRMSLPGK